jgi:hypothetical protein
MTLPLQSEVKCLYHALVYIYLSSKISRYRLRDFRKTAKTTNFSVILKGVAIVGTIRCAQNLQIHIAESKMKMAYPQQL